MRTSSVKKSRSKSALTAAQLFELNQACEYAKSDHPFDGMINLVTLFFGTAEDIKSGFCRLPECRRSLTPAVLVSRDAVLEVFARLDPLSNPTTLPEV